VNVFWHLRRCKWGLCSSAILRSVELYFRTEVSGQHIASIFNGQSVQAAQTDWTAWPLKWILHVVPKRRYENTRSQKNANPIPLFHVYLKKTRRYQISKILIILISYFIYIFFFLIFWENNFWKRKEVGI
jgi:hypothetical protein